LAQGANEGGAFMAGLHLPLVDSPVICPPGSEHPRGHRGGQ
jgi:hypothetical protein